MSFETTRISTNTTTGFFMVKASNGVNTVTGSSTSNIANITLSTLNCSEGDEVVVTCYYVDETGSTSTDLWVSAINVQTIVTHGGYLNIVGSGQTLPTEGTTSTIAASSNIDTSNSACGSWGFFTANEIVQRGFGFNVTTSHTQAQFRFRDANSTAYEKKITLPLSVASTGTGYGFAQFDNNGSEIINSTAPEKTFAIYDHSLTVALNPNNLSGNTYDYTVPGLTSQSDLDANYVFVRTDGGIFNVFSEQTTHTISYLSPNTVRFQWAGRCTDLFGNPRTCTIFDAHTNVFDVYILGKTL